MHKSSLFYGASNNISPHGASGAADNLSALFSKASLSAGAHFNIKNFFSARLGIIKRVNQFCIFFSMSSLKSRLFHIEKDKHAYILCCYLGGIFSQQRARTAAIARNEGIFSRAHYFISYGAQKFPHALKCIFARDAAAAAAVTERQNALFSLF